MKYFPIIFVVFCFIRCTSPTSSVSVADYFATQDSGVQSGNVKMVEITTPKGKFHVWTKRFGNNPRIKVLLLHGGPG
jgi:proline iminopeptidase